MRKGFLALFALTAALSASAALTACSEAGKLNPFRRHAKEINQDNRDKRVSFLTFDEKLKVDPERAKLGVALPVSAVNGEELSAGSAARIERWVAAPVVVSRV